MREDAAVLLSTFPQHHYDHASVANLSVAASDRHDEVTFRATQPTA